MPVFDILSSLLHACLLSAALSADAFVASFAYGVHRIRIPLLSLGIICAVCTGILSLSLLLGNAVPHLLTPDTARLLGFGILLALGVFKLFDSALKAFIRKHCANERKLHFRFAGLRWILQVYADSTAADLDQSRSLSPAEAASLALALSLDGIAAGFGAGMAHLSLPAVLVTSALLTAAAVRLGDWAGGRAARACRLDISWAAGLLLVLLAFFRLWQAVGCLPLFFR